LLDTADRRGLTNIGQFDIKNVLLAFKHGVHFLWLLLTRRPDLVYMCIAQNVLGYLRDSLFLVPARLLRCRVVVHLHGSDFQNFYERSSSLLKWLIRFTLSRVRKAIVLAGNLRDVFRGLVPENRISVVQNGIRDVAESRNDNNYGRSPNSAQANENLRVVYLSTLKKAKGFMDFLHCIPYVVREEPAVRFVLAGERCYPEEMNEAETFIRNHNIGCFVEMPGIMVGEDKKRLLIGADVFVFPPVHPEGQPLVILEAMSAGLPVIVTSSGAIPVTVLDGNTGFIVPSGNPAAIAEKILLLLRNNNLRQRMGTASRERFLAHYTVDRWIREMAAIFHEVTEKH